MSATLMECGHAQNTTKADGSPYCVICDCSVVAPAEPDLTGRTARCGYYGQSAKRGKCESETSSKKTLAFFEHRPDHEHDTYYCGCWGWD